MELFIQIRDGKPYEHPIFGDNFREAFPHIDVDNLPPEFARFTRISKPVFAVQDFKVVSDAPVYDWVGGVVQDVWSVRDMTEKEKQAVVDSYTEDARQLVNYFKAQAITNRDFQTSDAAKAVWQEYIDVLEKFVVDDVFNPKVPEPPKLDSDGNPLSLNTPGSAPNVIG